MRCPKYERSGPCISEYGAAERKNQASDGAVAPSLRRLRFEKSQRLWLYSLSLLALVSWFFDWTGVMSGLLGTFVVGVLGINIGCHDECSMRGSCR